MGSGCDGKRMNVEGDRLSSLPDDLIHKILSFIDIKKAIETSVLSSRWRYIWTSMPCLNFSKMDYHTSIKFFKFVTCVMSRRDKQTEVSSVQLTSQGKHSLVFVKRILDITLNNESSRNVQHLNITNVSRGKKIEFPLSLFSSQSLKHLTLSRCTFKHPTTPTPSWGLPALTTLNFYRVTFDDDNCSDLFSNFANLKNLTLKDCEMEGGSGGFSICHPRLCNLTLENGHEGGNVVTPQLKNLTIRYWRKMLMISAPDLTSLHYKNSEYALKFSAELRYLEKVDICLPYLPKDQVYAIQVVLLLQQLCSVKYLTLNLEIIKLLSSSLELCSRQTSPFANLKSLKIYPAYLSSPKVTMSTEVKSYLLDGSPGATFTTVSYEEISAVKMVTSLRNLLTELHVLLDQWKGNSELNTKWKWHYWERMTGINEKIAKKYNNAVAQLKEIEGILTKLPASPQAMLQVSYSSLCAHVETIMGVMVDHLKIQYDKKPRLYFPELATTSNPSS